MKLILLLLFCSTLARSQTLQLHYDLRKTVDPKRNAKNFPTLYFEYWKGTDSSSTLVKLQADLLDEHANMGKVFVQVAKSFRVYKAFQLHLSYSGGLGLTQPREYSYTITNTFSAGISYPFQWNKAYLTAVLDMKFVPYKKPTIDPLFTLYWWKGLYNYRLEFLGDFSMWTENKNRGDDFTKTLTGKRFYFFGEPQLWYNITKKLAAGTRINMFYHVLTTDDVLLVYPAIGVRWKL